MKRSPSKKNNPAARDTSPAGGNSTAGHRKRLRGKFMRSGLAGLHDYEAIELLLTFAIPRMDVKPAAKALLKRFKTIRGIVEAPAGEVSSVKGVGENAAGLLALLKEAAGLYLGECGASNAAIKSPRDAVDFLRSSFSGDPPGLVAIYLSSKNEVLGLKEAATKFSYKDIIADALRLNARSVIFARFASDGSSAEILAAEKTAGALADAAAALDILVHDYIVVTGDAYTSAREAGWLKG